jgi:hypothetical protein
LNRTLKVVSALYPLFFAGVLTIAGQDLPNSKDPAGMKRYEGSELIGYRAPMFDEYLLPLGPPSSFSPPVYAKSEPVEGQGSTCTQGHQFAKNYSNEKCSAGATSAGTRR